MLQDYASHEHQNVAMRIPRELKLYDFSMQRQGNISLFEFDPKKFRCFEERASLKAAEFVHENLVMCIPGALKL